MFPPQNPFCPSSGNQIRIPLKNDSSWLLPSPQPTCFRFLQLKGGACDRAYADWNLVLLATRVSMWPRERRNNEMRHFLKFLGKRPVFICWIFKKEGAKCRFAEAILLIRGVRLPQEVKSSNREKLRSRGNVWVTAWGSTWSQEFPWTFQICEPVIYRLYLSLFQMGFQLPPTATNFITWVNFRHFWPSL